MAAGDYTASLPVNTAERADNNDQDLRFRGPQPAPQSKNTLNQSRIPLLSPRNGAKGRVPFSKTRTLKGAFHAAADPDERPTTPSGYTMSHERKPSVTSPMSDSSPPGELLETYRRIDDADNIAGFVAQDDYEIPQDEAIADRIRRLSPSPGARQYNYDAEGAEDSDGSNMSFLEDITDLDLRKKYAQHAKDERRLKRVTRKDAPVFSKAKVGTRLSLSAENLQRRNDEESNKDAELQLNIPTAWGGRGKVSKDWLSKISRSNGDNYQEEEQSQLPDQDLENDVDFTARSLQVSDSPPVRKSVHTREETQAPLNEGPHTNRLRGLKKEVPEEPSKPSGAGDPIPDTPVVVYRSAKREKPRIVNKEESQGLLRRLARAESSSATSTPEQKPAEPTILEAKTPVVTGAWIDTPITERATASRKDHSKDVTSPSKVAPDQETTQPEDTKISSSKGHQRPAPAPRRNLVKPKLPKSALEKVLEDAKNGDHSLLLGENTIDSLQNLLDDKPMQLDFKPITPSDSGGEDDTKPIDTSLPADEATIDRLNAKLQSLNRNINETRQGLTSLEHHINKDTKLPYLRKSRDSKTKPSSHLHDHTPCESCGLYGDGRLYFAFPLPRLWYRHTDTKRLRPTRLSWFLLVFFAWGITELAMCERYCHPVEAETCERNCLDPNAPRMPYVLPTMLWRWSHLYTIFNPIRTILVALFRFVAQLLGLWDGFVDTPPTPWAGGAPHEYAPPLDTGQFTSGPELGMEQDEFL